MLEVLSRVAVTGMTYFLSTIAPLLGRPAGVAVLAGSKVAVLVKRGACQRPHNY
jgi:hypothetical protein